MVGPPGSGKSMLAQRLPSFLPSILPPMDAKEMLEISMITSIAGNLTNGEIGTRRGNDLVDYVVYYRVSTGKQLRSGLGLEAQRGMIERFLRPDDVVLGEYTDIQSGRKNDRVELWKAIRLVRKHRAKLLLPRLDRFSRKVSFVAGIIDQGVDLVVSDNPNVSSFFLHLLASFAEEERRLISERTKLALDAAKERGTVLGVNGKKLAIQNKQEKEKFSMDVLPEILRLRKSGLSFGGIAAELNSLGIATPRNKRWYAQTVKNYASE